MLDLSQQTLHELEAKCIKEQPPAAMAACPLHVDCRGNLQRNCRSRF